MRKLTFSEWIAVAVAVVVVSYFFFFNGGLFGLSKGFDPVTNTQTAIATQNNVLAEPVQKPVVASTTPVPPKNNTSIMSNNTYTLPGIQVTDVKVGTGEEAVAGKTVVVNYTGRFTNGTVFDSSIPRGQPFDFVLGGGRLG
jgi:FKBP-type peptidyl-prolyl cis-trans isomerase